ncbi:uncharacterized protein LOC62_06G008414 [Vanrija pseudolonga]|uniref:Uncharacterized protein n=1 Tax=Vanrija pseudolonga TaxID=143232 RepID=A0AAF0YDT0_9TREE|nr:hypothetical protein LOC62_06G008414 [Vanrija pseudolonga]
MDDGNLVWAADQQDNLTAGLGTLDVAEGDTTPTTPPDDATTRQDRSEVTPMTPAPTQPTDALLNTGTGNVDDDNDTDDDDRDVWPWGRDPAKATSGGTFTSLSAGAHVPEPWTMEESLLREHEEARPEFYELSSAMMSLKRAGVPIPQVMFDRVGDVVRQRFALYKRLHEERKDDPRFIRLMAKRRNAPAAAGGSSSSTPLSTGTRESTLPTTEQMEDPTTPHESASSSPPPVDPRGTSPHVDM